jgi:hypothetical protein
VQEWKQNIPEAAMEEEERAKRWLGRKDKDGNMYNDWNMYGFCLKSASNLYQQKFCFDCNVFNVEKWNYSIPENINEYYAVMIDIHN